MTFNTGSNAPADNKGLTCPVCDNGFFAEKFLCRDYFVSGKVFTISACTECGMLVTADAPGEEEIAPFYQSEDYISHSNTHKGLVNLVYHQVRKLMLRQKFRLVVRATGLQKGKLLDIGAGTGFFVRQMQEKGWQATGTEKSNEARQFAASEHTCHILPSGAIEGLHDQSFDAITLWHVMEHLHDPETHWHHFSRLLNEHGKLVIALPNPGSYDARHYGKYWAAWDVPRHLWHFAPENVTAIARKYGFRVEKTCRLPFDSFYISMLSERYRKRSFPFLRGMVTGKISWLASLLNPVKCSSIVYIISRKVPEDQIPAR